MKAPVTGNPGMDILIDDPDWFSLPGVLFINIPILRSCFDIGISRTFCSACPLRSLR
jgi:hypothetical protein